MHTNPSREAHLYAVTGSAPMDRLVFFFSLQKAIICVSELAYSKTGFIGGLVIVFFSGKRKEEGCVLEYLD